MLASRILPPPPPVTLRVLEDLSPLQPPGFTRLVRRKMVASGSSGVESRGFVYDEIWRSRIDAVVIAAYYLDALGQPMVYLRSAPRPPVLLRPPSSYPDPRYVTSDGLWELPAGLVESGEYSADGLTECARRELSEELGFVVHRQRFEELGPSVYPSPGVIAERHYYFAVMVDPTRQSSPLLDGSPVEALGAVIAVSLSDGLRACRTGEIGDGKTELGLRRLAERLVESR